MTESASPSSPQLMAQVEKVDGAGSWSWWRKSPRLVAQVWKKRLDLRHYIALEPLLRRRSPPKKLTCTKKIHHLRHQLQAISRCIIIISLYISNLTKHGCTMRCTRETSMRYVTMS